MALPSSEISLDPAALERVGGPIAVQLLPGWTITWVACSQQEIDAIDPRLPGPNLAICRPLEDTTPERSLATVYVLTPWPANESLSSTIAHELTHAWISPLVAIVPDSDAAVMIEEQLVERMGNFLAGLPAAARRAIGHVVDTIAPARMRARISARAGARPGGQQMDGIAMLLAGLKAALAADDPKPFLESLIAEAEKLNGQAPPESEATPGAPGAAAKAGAPPPPPAAPGAAKTEGEAEARRARIAVIDADLERMYAARLPGEKTDLVVRARARLALTPATEKRIMDAPTFEAAQQILAIVEEAGGGTSARARSGVEPLSAPDAADGAGARGVEDNVLQTEGFTEDWIARYRARLTDEGPEGGASMLATGRAAKARTRARVAREQQKVPS